MILCSDGQHPHRMRGLTCLPVAIKNACTRGLTCGTIPLPPVTQNHPVATSAMHCKEHVHKLPSTGLPYFPLGLVTTITQFPCWLGRGRRWGGSSTTSARSTEGDVPATELSFLSHPSAGGVGARIQSFHHHTSADGHASKPLEICLGLRVVHPLQLLPQCLQFLGKWCPWPQFFLLPHFGAV